MFERTIHQDSIRSIYRDTYENVTLLVYTYTINAMYNVFFFITVTKPAPRKKDASLFSVRLVSRNKRVKALKESMPCESLMASIKSTHSDSLISWDSPKSFTFYARNKFYGDFIENT